MFRFFLADGFQRLTERPSRLLVLGAAAGAPYFAAGIPAEVAVEGFDFARRPPVPVTVSARPLGLLAVDQTASPDRATTGAGLPHQTGGSTIEDGPRVCRIAPWAARSFFGSRHFRLDSTNRIARLARRSAALFDDPLPAIDAERNGVRRQDVKPEMRVVVY